MFVVIFQVNGKASEKAEIKLAVASDVKRLEKSSSSSSSTQTSGKKKKKNLQHFRRTLMRRVLI